MIKFLKIGKYKLTITFAPVSKVIGVNSNLPDGTHVLMWDFDEVEFESVMFALSSVQRRYNLSDIYLLQTKEPSNYIAYCFSSQVWRRAVEIIAATQYVDWQFFRFGVYRGHFTLRVTAKEGRIPYLIKTLTGYTFPNCEPSDLRSWVRYETLI